MSLSWRSSWRKCRKLHPQESRPSVRRLWSEVELQRWSTTNRRCWSNCWEPTRCSGEGCLQQNSTTLQTVIQGKYTCSWGHALPERIVPSSSTAICRHQRDISVSAVVRLDTDVSFEGVSYLEHWAARIHLTMVVCGPFMTTDWYPSENHRPKETIKTANNKDRVQPLGSLEVPISCFGRKFRICRARKEVWQFLLLVLQFQAKLNI